MAIPDFIPYCGVAPVPATLSWNLDPLLLAFLCGTAVGYWRFAERNKQNEILFYSALVVLSLAWISPLCNLGVALFSARVGQHILIGLLAAPLLAGGIRPWLRYSKARHTALSAATYAVVLWFWHIPAAYDLTLQDNWAYWTMQITLLGAAVCFWLTIFSASTLASFGAVFVISMQMSLLGALLTSSARSLYAAHTTTTEAWGLSALGDQASRGTLMLALGGLVFNLYGVRAAATLLCRLPPSHLRT